MILKEFEYRVVRRTNDITRQYPHTAVLDDGREAKFQVENLIGQYSVVGKVVTAPQVTRMLIWAMASSDYKSQIADLGVKLCIQPSSIL